MGAAKSFIDVAVVSDPTWQKNTFTYQSTKVLEEGRVVVVPFGKQEKLGIVTSLNVKQPEAVTPKQIMRSLPIRLDSKTIAFYRSMSEHYPGMPGAHLQHFLPSVLKKVSDDPTYAPEPVTQTTAALSLTAAQQAALEDIQRSASATNVLHGITGSGKTRLYAELIRQTTTVGKNALLLYPEISLTTQLFTALRELLGSEHIVVFHSKLTPKQTMEAWMAIYAAKRPVVVIGPRSALFLPLKNLGYIVIDEAHDASLKQDTTTRYNGVFAAGLLARIHDAKLLLGSATPPVQETYQIEEKGGSVVRLRELAIKNTTTREISIVDMTKARLKGSTGLLSEQLLGTVKTSLHNEAQSLLFLNRRGTAKLFMCESCGWHAMCPRCEIPQTFHHDKHTLQCHLCGLTSSPHNVCPDCSAQVQTRAHGTKALLSELEKLFPEARVARFDSDSAKSQSFHEQYENIRQGSVDILVGTQLLTKGLDLPKLETVGVLQADSALFLPDYSSRERTFQQLMQVSGRVGRGHANGRVIVQTYQPNSEVLAQVLRQDWRSFYKQELQQRQKLMFPPFTFMLKLSTAKATAKSAQTTLDTFIQSFSAQVSDIRGPSPSFYEKQRGKHNWQAVVFSNSRQVLVDIAQAAPKGIVYELDPVSLL